MNELDILKTVQTLSPAEIDALLRSIRKKKPYTKKKKHVSFSLRINNRLFRQIAKGEDVIKHFMETLVPDLEVMPPYAIKSQIVGMFEMLAETEEHKTARDKWRQKASKVVMIDNQKHLFAYVTTLATGIKM